jgi:beta-galactosidase/beta-glucuronidase
VESIVTVKSCVRGIALSIGLLVSIEAQARSTAAAAHAAAKTPSAGRVRINFNADWRFMLGKAEGADKPVFDDAGWQPVGLPHSFSMPYFRASSFYTGDGWYRKAFTLPALAPDRRLSLEFEGAFQDAHVFVNGIEVAHHRGGYTGFPVDISAAVHPGRNLVAVRVNNEWDPTLAPRAGEHVFSGGLYRDVWLVETDAVHVPWTGTRITTPDLSDASGKVAAETEVRNDLTRQVNAIVHTRILDQRGLVVATPPDAHLPIAPGSTAIAQQVSPAIQRPRLWSPETPNLYRAVTTVTVD